MMKQIFLLSCLFLIVSCKDSSNLDKQVISTHNAYKKIAGKTMGTTYNITLKDSLAQITKEEIDALLLQLNLSVSTYIDTSTISKINQADKYGKATTILKNGQPETFTTIELPIDQHLIRNYALSRRIFLETNGAFDPTIMPLVNYWGFGYTPKKAITEADKDSIQTILAYVGLEKVTLEASDQYFTVTKPPNTELDFSGVAKGYGVDLIAKYLETKGISDYMVEIGGEVYAVGRNPKGQYWKIGLNTPKDNAAINDFINIIKVDKVGVASSGNYRIFHEVNGQKYGHEINPDTGFPELNELLAVSIIAPTCAEADAIATACMIMGLESAYEYISSYQNIEGSLYYSDKDGRILSKHSAGMSDIIVKNN